MTESRTLEELERMYSVEKRNATAYRLALEKIITYCGEKALKLRSSGFTAYLMQISSIAQSAMSATGEMPVDGFKR